MIPNYGPSQHITVLCAIQPLHTAWLKPLYLYTAKNVVKESGSVSISNYYEPGDTTTAGVFPLKRSA